MFNSLSQYLQLISYWWSENLVKFLACFGYRLCWNLYSRRPQIAKVHQIYNVELIKTSRLLISLPSNRCRSSPLWNIAKIFGVSFLLQFSCLISDQLIRLFKYTVLSAKIPASKIYALGNLSIFFTLFVVTNLLLSYFPAVCGAKQSTPPNFLCMSRTPGPLIFYSSRIWNLLPQKFFLPLNV